ncbi:alpha/beta fold hydrolase [bacterium]
MTRDKQQTMIDHELKTCCESDCQIDDEMVSLSNGVSLRLITFRPVQKSHLPSVVFIAGWVSRIESWQNVLREMTKDFVVYYVETREKNSSKVPKNANFNVNIIGDDIIQLIDILGLQEKQYLLFGSSLGATVIIECYSRLKLKPCCLTLVAPNAEFRMPIIWKLIITFFYPPFYFILKPWVKWYLRCFRLNIKKDSAQYEKYCRALDGADPFKLKPAALAFSRYQIWNVLSLIDTPVLLIGGSHDKLHEPENLRRITEILPVVQYVDLEINSRTHTAEVVTVLRQFIHQWAS